MGELYKLEFPSGKSYIGITTKTAERRFRQHRRDVSRHDLLLYRAWKAHGEPKLTVLAILTDAELFDAEIRAIKLFGTLSPNGYNATIGGDISPALMPEVAKKIGDRHRGRFISAGWRAKLGNSNRGKTRSEDIKKRMSLAQTGRKHTPETLAKIAAIKSSSENIAHLRELAASQRGKKLPPARAEEARRHLYLAMQDPIIVEKISASRVGRKHSEKTKQKMRAAALGKQKSAEHRANIAASRRGKKVSDEARANMSLSRTGRKHSAETIQKMKDAWERRRNAIQSAQCNG